MQTFNDDIIIHPIKTRRDRSLPESGIFIATPGEAKAAAEKIRAGGGEKYPLHHSRLSVDKSGEKFVAGPALGAPAAVLVLEKLIVLGGQRILFFGWCGGVAPELKVGDIVIPEAAVSGEGTSRYYQQEQVLGVSANLREKLVKRLEQRGQKYSSGNVWSTDAPYRESRSELRALHQQQNVVCVDMEFSALAAVSKFRGIEFAGVMVVSDELLSGKWRPGFKNPVFRSSCQQVLDCLMKEEW